MSKPFQTGTLMFESLEPSEQARDLPLFERRLLQL